MGSLLFLGRLATATDVVADSCVHCAHSQKLHKSAENFPSPVNVLVIRQVRQMNNRSRGNERTELDALVYDFTGQLISQGNIVIGSGGKLEGNIEGMASVLVDGKVVGNITADTVCLRNQAAVFGNITCKSITVDPEVTIVGEVNINPRAPQLFDMEGNEVLR